MQLNYCPKKHENHEEFYRKHPKSRTAYWVKYFAAQQKVTK